MAVSARLERVRGARPVSLQKPLHPLRPPLPVLEARPRPAMAGPGSRRLAWGWGAGGASLFALILLVIFFQWNWLRGPLALWLSGRLNRPVAISGDLTVHPWSGHPWAVVRGLAVGQPAWVRQGAAAGPMLQVPALTFQWRWTSLLGGRAAFPLVRFDRPSFDLVGDAAGRHDWDFDRSGLRAARHRSPDHQRRPCPPARRRARR